MKGSPKRRGIGVPRNCIPKNQRTRLTKRREFLSNLFRLSNMMSRARNSTQVDFVRDFSTGKISYAITSETIH
ncbi:MAG: hypothetical protein KDD70_00335 [Bdellovibrionales bacterium]|nr:hypothetical protein [Bdellovibrionales bacterium]